MLGAPKYIYAVVFGLGLIVQFLFSVTLMTLSATISLVLLNLLYTAVTGVYLFVDSNIPIAVFLGLHLLMTDPSTSPRTDLGKVIFGGLYGLGVFVVYSWLFDAGAPRFYDKLLAVPLLNLSVHLMDRFANWCVPARIADWRTTLRPETLNRCYMVVWAIVFGTMIYTGFIQAPHPGESIALWKQACENDQPRACRNLLAMLRDASVRGSGEALNELGIMYVEGNHVSKDASQATYYFAESCRRGHPEGCANASIQFLFHGVARSTEEAVKALDYLEQNPGALKAGRSFYLLGFAYENGRGRPVNLKKAGASYSRGCDAGDVTSCKQLARLSLQPQSDMAQRQQGAAALEKACALGDAESCLYLAQMYHTGGGVPPDESRARLLLEKACQLGAKPACTLLETLKK
jgi:TPR repeat protein